VQNVPYWDEFLSVSPMFTSTSNAAKEKRAISMRVCFSRAGVAIASSALAIRFYV
jgi:hypothetical protein